MLGRYYSIFGPFAATCRAAKSIGASMEKPYAFSKAATLEHIKPATVINASNTKMLAILQSVVDAVITGDYKATSHDVRYLDICATSKDKQRCTVRGAKHADMRDTIGNVIYRIASGEDYRIAYKEAKQK